MLVKVFQDYLNNHQYNNKESVFGYLSIYIGHNLNVSIDGVEVLNDGLYQYNGNISQILDVVLTFGEKEVLLELNVFSQDDILTTIFSKELLHLEQFASSDNTIQLGYNLYLPTILKSYNATVSYFSSDDSIMTNEGKLMPEKQGNITLTAHIYVNNKIYTKVYYIHVVQQDNQDKLQYLAILIEGSISPFTSLYDSSNESTYYSLPTIDTYQTLFNIRNLGILELSYELESNYYYMGLDIQTENLPDAVLIPNSKMTSAIIYLKQITYQKTARLTIKARFDNDEVVQAYINLNISLDQGTLQNQIFSDVQTYLDSVDILGLMLESRNTLGVKNVNADFSLPKEIGTVNLSYKAKSDSPYILEIKDGVTYVSFKNKFKEFDITDKRIPLTVVIKGYDELGNEKDIERDLYFIIPGALTPVSFAPFQDIETDHIVKSFYYSLLYQVLLQTNELMKYDENINLIDANITNILALESYILINDLVNVKEFVFEYGNESVILDKYDLSFLSNIFTWASSSSTDTFIKWAEANNITVINIDKHISWIQADGISTLSDGEIEFIIRYGDKYSFFKSIFSKYINTLDNTLSSSDISDLTSILATDQIFANILDWIMNSTEYVTISEYLNEQGVTGFETYFQSNQALLNTYNDELETISNEEERVILFYVYNRYILTENNLVKYEAFYNVWVETVERNNAINDGTVKRFDGLKYTGSKFSTTVGCYDIIFPIILGWALDYGTSLTLSSALLGAGVSSEEMVNIFSETELAYTNTWLTNSSTSAAMVTKNEWRIIEKYLSFYGISYSNLGITVDVFYDDRQSNQPTVTSQYIEVTKASFLFWTYYATNLNSSFVTMAINDINSKYTEILYKNESFINQYNTIYDEAIKTYEQNPKYQIVNGLMFSDGKSKISYDEYCLLNELFITFKESISNKTVILENTYQISDVIINYYWSKASNEFEDITSQKLDQNRAKLINTIENLATFQEIIDKITSLGSSSSLDTDYFDNLSTISKEELQYLVDAYKDNLDFIKKLNELITSFRINLETFIVETVTDGVDRELSSNEINEILTSLATILGGNGKKFQYLVIPQIDALHTDLFTVLQYFPHLESLALKGNEFTSLFKDATIGDMIYSANYAANIVFQTIVNSNVNLMSLVFNYSSLYSIQGLENLLELQYLEIKGNSSPVQGETGLSDVSEFLLLLAKKLSNNKNPLTYLNIYGNDIEESYAEIYLMQLYNAYKDYNLYYFYSMNGEETIFKFDDANMVASELASLIKKIGSITTQYLYLPTQVTNGTYIGNITWSIVSGATYISIFDNKYIENLNINGTAIVMATVTVDINNDGLIDQSYSRYFVIEVKKF